MAVTTKIKYFTNAEFVRMEETCNTEFKAHMCLQESEIALWMYEKDSERRSKSPISKTLNAFLNAGTGGTVYLGILDSGEVKGFPLTQYKKDHLMINLDDLMAQYNPPVEKARYKMRFVPVVAANSTKEEISRTIAFDSSKGSDINTRQRPHVVRARHFCWCDKDLQARVSTAETIVPFYVVEITIKPWSSKFDNALGQLKASPMHEDEVGKVYFRRQASVGQYTKQEVIVMTKEEVGEYYKPKISDMEDKIHELRLALKRKLELELQKS